MSGQIRTAVDRLFALEEGDGNLLRVPLDTGMIPAAASAKTAFAAVYVHTVQKKFCYGMTG